MRTFKFKKTNLRWLLVLAIVLSGLVLWLNDGFKFSFYQQTWVVQFPQSVDEQVLNSFLNRPFVAALDRGDKRMELQDVDDVSLNELKGELDALFPEEKAQFISSSTVISSRTVLNIGLSLLIISIAVWGWNFLGVRKQFSSKSLYSQLWRLNMLTVVASLVIGLGLMSLLSLVYKLSMLSFSALVIAGLWVIWHSQLAFWTIRSQKSLEKALDAHSAYWNKVFVENGRWLVLFFVVLGAVLGGTYLLDLALCVVLIVGFSYMQQEFYHVLLNITAILKSRLPKFILPRK